MCFGIYFNTEVCHINQNWENLDKHLGTSAVIHQKIPGDGFCFIKSVLEGLQEDHKVVIDIEVAQHEILDHLIEQHRDYVAYHAEDEMKKINNSVIVLAQIQMSLLLISWISSMTETLTEI